jgi:hypothetical protein
MSSVSMVARTTPDKSTHFAVLKKPPNGGFFYSRNSLCLVVGQNVLHIGKQGIKSLGDGFRMMNCLGH